MSAANTGFVVDETSSAAPGQRVPRELTYVPEAIANEDGELLALGAAVLALANYDRAIRHQPPVTGASDLHPEKIATCLRAVRTMAMAQHPSASLHAVSVATKELREILDRLITDPEAAVVNDPERMEDACAGLVRLVIEKYQNTLYGALATVRAEQSAQGRG